MATTYGRIPQFPHQRRILSSAEALEGKGWDNLGPRKPKFIALHRMVGTLWGTDGYFRNPAVASLTDYGVGIQTVDGANNAGLILQWNDPTGVRSGWASGPVSKPYGGGKCIVDKFGVNAVNRDGISLEISGTNQPLDDKAWRSIVHFCAWWLDWMKIPYTALPKNPHTGCDALIYHQEFTIGTGKECPFRWMMDNTPRLYKDVAAMMKQYQEAGSATPEPSPYPEPTPEPKPDTPTFATRRPIAEVKDTPEHVVLANGAQLVRAKTNVRARRATSRLQYASPTAAKVGSDLWAGERFETDYLVINPDRSLYWYTSAGTRIRFEDTEPIVDA